MTHTKLSTSATGPTNPDAAANAAAEPVATTQSGAASESGLEPDRLSVIYTLTAPLRSALTTVATRSMAKSISSPAVVRPRPKRIDTLA